MTNGGEDQAEPGRGAGSGPEPSEPPRRGDSDGGGAPAGEEQSGGDDESGFPWGMACLGCGCAALMTLVCGAGVAVMFSGYFMKDFAETAQQEIEVRKEVREERMKLVEENDVEDRLERPLASGDFEAFQATIEDWKDSKPFDQLESLADYEDADGEESFTEKLQALYLVWKSASAMTKLGSEYVEAIEGNGGLEEHYERVLGIGALVAATHEVATDSRFDAGGGAASDEVAALLYDDHDEVLEKYEDEIEDLKSGDRDFESLASEGNLGAYAIAALPNESYEIWNDFSEEEREKVFETFGWTISAEALTFGGFAFPIELGTELPIRR